MIVSENDLVIFLTLVHQTISRQESHTGWAKIYTHYQQALSKSTPPAKLEWGLVYK